MRLFNILFLILLYSTPILGQTNIQLFLTNKGDHKIDKVDAFDLSQKEIYEYTYKDTLALNFKKKNIDCYNIRYHENGKQFRQQIWLDTGNVKIQAHIMNDKLVIDTVINSPFYYKAKAFNKQYADLYRTKDTNTINEFLLTAYRNNIDNPFSIAVGNIYVMLNQNSKANLLTFKPLYDSQGEKFSWFLIYPSTIERLNKLLTIKKVNVSNYPFLNKDNTRTKLTLNGADFYVLDLWFLACPPCLQDHKKIKEEINSLKNKKVEMISISIDKTVKNWNDYLITHNYTWQNYLEGNELSISKDLSVSAFPTYIILNNDGDIINTYNSITDVLKTFHIEK